MLEFSNEENKVFHGEEVGRRQTRKQIRCSVMALVRNADKSREVEGMEER